LEAWREQGYPFEKLDTIAIDPAPPPK
jgi:hypothetical protein